MEEVTLRGRKDLNTILERPFLDICKYFVRFIYFLNTGLGLLSRKNFRNKLLRSSKQARRWAIWFLCTALKITRAKSLLLDSCSGQQARNKMHWQSWKRKSEPALFDCIMASLMGAVRPSLLQAVALKTPTQTLFHLGSIKVLFTQAVLMKLF